MASEVKKEITQQNNLSQSELEKNIEYCLSNLKILKNIKSNDKLYYENDTFYLDEPAYVQGVTRWWYSGSRINTLQSLNEFVEKLFKTINSVYSTDDNDSEITNTYYSKVTKTANVFKEENSKVLMNFTTCMTNAIDGLTNLKTTYKDDVTTVSNIEIIIEKINVRVKKINGLLSIKTSSSN
jgi:hypothetical protein